MSTNTVIGKLSGIRIRPGNAKVTCPTVGTICHRWEEKTSCHGCYALDEMRYPSVRKSRGLNEKAFQYAPVSVGRDIGNHCIKVSAKYFRWNSAGEFNTPKHLMALKIAAITAPETIFFGYTKETLPGLASAPSNVVIRPTGTELNYGTLEEMTAKQRANPKLYWICPCRPGVNSKGICGNRCTACPKAPKHMIPLFIGHGRCFKGKKG